MHNRRKKRVIFNISGVIYETFEKTLARFPRTLLGDKAKRQRYYCSIRQQYVFYRNHRCFGSILFFFQSNGVLACPKDIQVDDLVEECTFFEIPCASIDQMKLKEGVLPESEESRVKVNGSEYWNFLENPDSSFSAYVYHCFVLSLIVASIVLDCLYTVNFIRQNLSDLIKDCLLIVEFTVNLYFAGELFLRFILCPLKIFLVKSALFWIDFLATFPYFLILFITQDMVIPSYLWYLIRILRILRIFRSAKYSNRLKVIGEILEYSTYDFGLLVKNLAVLLILGASGIYYLEGFMNPGSKYTSIPASLWWTVISVSTVGYGDVVPETLTGKLFASCFITLFITAIMLPVLYLADKYTKLYISRMTELKCNVLLRSRHNGRILV